MAESRDVLTQEVFAEGVAILQARWPRHEITPALAGVYAEALSVLTGTEFIVGVKRAVAELEFFPTAKQIREFGRPELPADVEASAVLTQILADDEVKTYDVRVGSGINLAKIGERYGLAAQMAVSAIGIRRIAQGVNDRDFPFVLKDFRSHYTAFADDLRSRGEVQRLSSGEIPAIGGATSHLFPALDPRRRLNAPERVGDIPLPLDFRERAAGED